MRSGCIFGFRVVDFPCSSCAHVVCRKLKISKMGSYLVIGVSAPGTEPNGYGHTHGDSSSYCMGSGGELRAAGQWSISDAVPASSIIQPDLFKQREDDDKAFTAGDEVLVTLDCSAHTLRLQSPTVDHTISILQQHHNPQQQWVLNVNLFECDYDVKLT